MASCEDGRALSRPHAPSDRSEPGYSRTESDEAKSGERAVDGESAGDRSANRGARTDSRPPQGTAASRRSRKDMSAQLNGQRLW